jgi:hypothetical protein
MLRLHTTTAPNAMLRAVLVTFALGALALFCALFASSCVNDVDDEGSIMGAGIGDESDAEQAMTNKCAGAAPSRASTSASTRAPSTGAA